jgi:RNA recognition motif-containing protein
MRGQAFVKFKELESAKKSFSLQHYPLFNNKIVLNYAFDHMNDKSTQEQKYQQLKEKVVTTPMGMPKFNLVPEEHLPPNNILFVQHLPSSDQTEQLLKGIFARFAGFREVRLVPGRSDIAFIEFENEIYAMQAKDAADGREIKKDWLIKVTYARR